MSLWNCFNWNVFERISSFLDFIEDDNSEEEEEGGENEDEIEKKINNEGWFNLSKGVLIQIVKSHFDWTLSSGYIENGNVIRKDNMIEVDLFEEQKEKEEIKNFDCEKKSNPVLIIEFPWKFPSVKDFGEIMIVFGDKAKILKPESSITLLNDINDFHVHVDNSFEKNKLRNEYSFEKENIIKCNEQNIKDINSHINELKKYYRNSFILVYKKNGHQTKFFRIVCDHREIKFLWTNRIYTQDPSVIKSIKNVNQLDNHLLNVKDDEEIFFLQKEFLFVTKTNIHLKEDKKIDYVIPNMDSLWKQNINALFLPLEFKNIK